VKWRYSINKLLKRSLELETALTKLIKLKPYENSDRAESSRIMCSVAFEHAESLKMLISTGNFTSAIGLLRLQYEALTRAMWLFYAASDIAVSKLMNELNQESSRKSQNLPMLSEMLKKLEDKAPKVALDQLLEFREYSWKPLSSYIHGGIHAVQRHSKGYPAPLLFQSVKASNGVSVMVGMLLIILSEDITKSGLIPQVQREYLDCLPDLKTNF
jgi:hypothetical protein